MTKRKKIQEPTTDDVLAAMNEFSIHVDKCFEGIDKRFGSIDQRFEGIESDIRVIKATMVTKDYLDEKLADLRGDLVVLIRKEDNKLKKLIDILCQHKLISSQEKKQILSLEPFAQI